MLANEYSDELIKEKYQSICENLNISNASVTNLSWSAYQSVKNDHTLDVSTNFRFFSSIEIITVLFGVR